jgi:hypothetical protein
VDVDPHDPLELRELDLLQRAEGQDAGVVDQHADRSEEGLGLGHDGLPVGLVGDVEVAVGHRVTQLVGGPAALVVEDVADHDLGALRREQPGLGRALAPGSPADQRDLARQPSGGRHDVGFSAPTAHMAKNWEPPP